MLAKILLSICTFVTINSAIDLPPSKTNTTLTKNNHYITPLKDKEIIVITSESICPYCEKLDKNIIQDYKGSIPLRVSTKDKLKGFTFVNRH